MGVAEAVPRGGQPVPIAGLLVQADRGPAVGEGSSGIAGLDLVPAEPVECVRLAAAVADRAEQCVGLADVAHRLLRVTLAFAENGEAVIRVRRAELVAGCGIPLQREIARRVCLCGLVEQSVCAGEQALGEGLRIRDAHVPRGRSG